MVQKNKGSSVNTILLRKAHFHFIWSPYRYGCAPLGIHEQPSLVFAQSIELELTTEFQLTMTNWTLFEPFWTFYSSFYYMNLTPNIKLIPTSDNICTWFWDKITFLTILTSLVGGYFWVTFYRSQEQVINKLLCILGITITWLELVPTFFYLTSPCHR